MDVKNVSVFKQEAPKGEFPKTNSISELAMDIYMGPGRKGVAVMSQEEKDDTKWHDFQTAQYAGKILTGIVAGTEMQEENGIVLVMCEDTLVSIPVEDMGLVNASSVSKSNDTERLMKLAGSMLMAEVDFIVKEVDRSGERIIGSRVEAMRKRCERLYFGDTKQIYPGRVVEARIIGVSAQSVRVEVYGVLAKMNKKELTRAFIADCSEMARVGQRILVYVDDVRGTRFENVSVSVNAVMVTEDNTEKELAKLKIDGKYLGKVTGISAGIYFIRLTIGCNVACHKCLTSELPTVGDKVALVIRYIDPEKRIGRGIITQLLGSGY